MLAVAELMRQSGVGSLPVLTLPTESGSPVVPNEQHLMADTSKSVSTLFEAVKRGQESAGVVANLLRASEQPNTKQK